MKELKIKMQQQSQHQSETLKLCKSETNSCDSLKFV
jgi:hypothetical protein